MDQSFDEIDAVLQALQDQCAADALLAGDPVEEERNPTPLMQEFLDAEAAALADPDNLLLEDRAWLLLQRLRQADDGSS